MVGRQILIGKTNNKYGLLVDYTGRFQLLHIGEYKIRPKSILTKKHSGRLLFHKIKIRYNTKACFSFPSLTAQIKVEKDSCNK